MKYRNRHQTQWKRQDDSDSFLQLANNDKAMSIIMNQPTRLRPSFLASLTLLMTTICSLSMATNTFAQEAPEPAIEYSIDFSDAINNYITIEMRAPASGAQTEVMMATWTPGSYLVREYARRIDQISATDDKGNPLEFAKTRKNRWTIETPDQESFTLTYRLFCDELSVRTNFVTRGYAVLNGAATFLTFPDNMDIPHVVELDLPEQWKQSATSLRRDGEDHRYRAENFDELVDSPIAAGNVDIFPFEVAGIDHFLVNINGRGTWDADRVTEDLAKLVSAHHDMWDTIPYDRYYFLNVIGGGGGGLEHDNSCLVMSSEGTMRDESSYYRFLSLCSHEFFHTWNIRRLRPKSLVKYDYESEVYTPSLWVAEGVTSYFEDLLLVRAGLLDREKFVSELGRQIRSVQLTEGRKVQSLRDSSHDAWIKFYRPAANSRSTQISYYSKGAIVAMLLDARIRAASDGVNSLDDAMRMMYQNHADGVGYTPEDFRKTCSEVAGEDLSDWFASAVDSTDELDFQEMADWYGLSVGDIKPTQEDSDEEEDEKEEKKKKRKSKRQPTRWIGVGESGSPATEKGISDDDEIIAINDLRLETRLRSRLQEFNVGDPIKLLISREGKLMEVLMVVGSQPPTPSWDLKIFKDATKAQTRNLEDWASDETIVEEIEDDEESEEVDEDDEVTPDDEDDEEAPAEDPTKDDSDDDIS